MTNAGRLELWGGVECTVNRVGKSYFDQLAMNGHADRLADLNLFADLGLAAIRYAVLWERTAPHYRVEYAHWEWPDARLSRLQQLRIRPIVGLVHHGSGPSWTSLTSPSFATGLARYAQAIAQRYPWVDAYTPVNEPLTTARFSALYGHWYPHAQDARTFVRALLNQCKATCLAMAKIREVNSQAQLIQTEDIGYTFSTPALAYQAEFENTRRWLTFDLLSGRVNVDHPLWSYLIWLGTPERQLEWFWENPCPPDVIGINYYVTSERYLDEKVDKYPSQLCGTNGRHRYADVEAVRARPQGIMGLEQIIQAAWQRYRTPIALTEVHLGCSDVNEQLRWFWEAWQTCTKFRANQVPVRAVTAWSMLGSFDWCTLLTSFNGEYEAGVYDVRDGVPKPTRLWDLIRDLNHGALPNGSAYSEPGWWRRQERLIYPG